MIGEIASLILLAVAGANDQPAIELYGETHGIAGSYDFLLQRAQEVVETGEKLIVALELPADEPDILQQRWASDDATIAAEEVRRLGWCDLPDGRASLELVSFLEALHPASSELDVQIALVPGPVEFKPDMTFAERGTLYSSAMGRELAGLADTIGRGRVLALAGSTHAKAVPHLLPESLGGGEAMTAGAVLDEKATSILMIHEPGTAHVCTFDGCSAYSTAGNAMEWNPEVYEAYVNIGPAEAITPLSETEYCR